MHSPDGVNLTFPVCQVIKLSMNMCLQGNFKQQREDFSPVLLCFKFKHGTIRAEDYNEGSFGDKEISGCDHENVIWLNIKVIELTTSSVVRNDESLECYRSFSCETRGLRIETSKR